MLRKARPPEQTLIDYGRLGTRSAKYVIVGVVGEPDSVALTRICVPFATLVGLIENGINSSLACALVVSVIGGATKSTFPVVGTPSSQMSTLNRLTPLPLAS